MSLFNTNASSSPEEPVAIEVPSFAERIGTEVRESFPSRINKAVRNIGLLEDIATSPDEDKKLPTRPKSWAKNEDCFFSVGETMDSLPPDLYACRVNNSMGPHFVTKKNELDEIVPLSSSESAKILAEIEHFKTLRPRFQELGFLFKRGILLWGPPGSGKTITVQQLIELFIHKYKGIAVMSEHPEATMECLRMFRKLEPERDILVILEDFDELVRNYGETYFLNMLDGEGQLQNIVYVATTNYPERLDKRFVDRPSRFDIISYVGMPNATSRAEYIKAKVPNIESEILTQIVDASKDFSIAYVREMVVQTQCFGKSIEESLAHITQMKKKQPDSTKSPDAPSFGFGGR